MVGIRARRKAERPGQILEAAFDEFVLKGYSAARLEDVAKRVGVTKGTIYFYFGSKERVFEEAIRMIGSLPLAAFNNDPTPFTSDIVEDIRIFLRDLYRFIDANPRTRETLRLLVAEAQRFPQAVDTYFAMFMDPVIGRLQSRLAQAAAGGEIRRDVPYGAEAIVSPPLAYMVMSLLFKDRRGIDAEQLAHSQLEFLLGGLHPADGRAPAPADHTDAWTEWRPAPKPGTGEALSAPISAGIYELRLTSGELLLLGSASNVAARLAAILSAAKASRGERADASRRYVMNNLHHLQYRTRACVTIAEARRIVESAGSERHRFEAGAFDRAARSKVANVEDVEQRKTAHDTALLVKTPLPD